MDRKHIPARTGSPALDVVTVTWNGSAVVAACLRSALELAPAAIVVVDNASTDGTADIVRRGAPSARVIRNPKNRGFAAACNQGMKESAAQYVLLLNQDALALPDGVTALLTYMDRQPKLAVAGGRIENPDGTLQPSMGPEPRPLRVALDRIPLLRHMIHSHVYRHPRAYASAREPAWLTGACLLIRRAAFDDVGPFDEAYFMYTEDLDWCTRARKRGWKLQYLPVRTAVHADEGRRPDRARAKAAWMREGLRRYFMKYGTSAEVRLFRLILAAERITKV